MTNFHLKVPDSVKTLIADNSWMDGGGAGDVKKCNSIKFQEILVSAAAWQLEIVVIFLIFGTWRPADSRQQTDCANVCQHSLSEEQKHDSNLNPLAIDLLVPNNPNFIDFAKLFSAHTQFDVSSPTIYREFTVMTWKTLWEMLMMRNVKTPALHKIAHKPAEPAVPHPVHIWTKLKTCINTIDLMGWWWWGSI